MTQRESRIIEAYEAWLKSWAAERTVQARVRVAAGRIREWGLAGLTSEAIQGWLGRKELKSAWSRATYHAHLRDFCGWLVATGRLDEDPMAAVRAIKRPRSKPHPLSEAEVTRVLGAAMGETRHWILLALLAGLRAHEIAKIRGEDVTEQYLYVEGKGGTREELPTHPDLWAIAQEYPRTGYWFPDPGEEGHVSRDRISIRVGSLFRAVGIPKGSIHRCRHVYGTRLLRAGVHIRTVQKLMRHASLETTAAYTAVDDDELREAIGRLSA